MDQLQPGQMLGPYRIISQIGQGGMATVYKAYQPSMDRNVAVKVLPGQLATSKEFTERFQQEARIIARLEHAHILPVFDYGESEGISYFVMRYLEAGTLKEKMEANRPLPLPEIDRLFSQLADALSYAHSQGVIHRDLKPANALIDSRGNLFLTDFGIAKILESASPRLTQTDAIMGTPAYISPEQAQAQKVDQRSDIYSLGIILYEMVTGQVPYTADTPLAVILKHVSNPLPLPSSIKPDIPEAIEQVILKALAKNPDDRFDTVAEFEAAWKRALNVKDTDFPRFNAPTVLPSASSTPLTQGQPVSATMTAVKSGNNTRWIFGCLIGACLLFSIAGIAYAGLNWKNFFPANQNPAATDASATDVPASDGSTTSTPSGSAVEQRFEVKIGDEIKNGEPEAGAGLIEAPGSKDVYTFNADPGQKIYVHIIELPASSDLVTITLKDDLGSDVFNTCLQCSDPGLITLDRGGKYTLTVGNDDPSGAGYGAYRIKLWNVPAPDEFSIELGQNISRDKPGPGSGYIENPGSFDVYTFTAESGQAVFFQVTQMPTTSDIINWRAEDDSGNVIFDTCLACGDPGLLTLDRGGKYTITVGSKNSHGTGTYAIKVWAVPAPDEFTINIGDTVSRDNPGPGAGFIDTPGSSDIYTFTAIAGQTVTLKITELPDTSDVIYWRLEDESGKELFNTCLACGDPGTLTLEQGGNYTIIVGSNTTSPGTGKYGFQLTSP
ncbi:MAG: serine/threonine-protein kinase [Chloroflexota bacterium]